MDSLVEKLVYKSKIMKKSSNRYSRNLILGDKTEIKRSTVVENYAGTSINNRSNDLISINQNLISRESNPKTQMGYDDKYLN
jgi:hypothetical protein